MISSRTAAVLALALAACGQPAPAPQAPSNAAPSRPPVADDPALDEVFRAEVQRQAIELGLRVRAWGTAPLAVDEPIRFATVAADDTVETGAYFLMDTRGRWWRVDFTVDGRSRLWPEQGDGGPEAPPWLRLDDRTLTVWQGWRGGYDEMQLALQDGELRLARRGHLEDARDSDVPEESDYTDDGVCGGRCIAIPEGGAVNAVVGPADPAVLRDNPPLS
ncbi:MAG: hypothetical protein R2939_04490 [Kofleriaceae bacterium]